MTFEEFKKEVNEIVRSKKGALPDMNDWKKIKQMMDEVEEKPTLSSLSYTLSNTGDGRDWSPYTDTVLSSYNDDRLATKHDLAVNWNGVSPSVNVQWSISEPNQWEQLSFDFDQ